MNLSERIQFPLKELDLRVGFQAVEYAFVYK